MHGGIALGTSITLLPSQCILASSENRAFFCLYFYCPASTAAALAGGEEHLQIYMTMKSAILVLSAGDWNAVIFLFSFILASSQTYAATFNFTPSFPTDCSGS